MRPKRLFISLKMFIEKTVSVGIRFKHYHTVLDAAILTHLLQYHPTVVIAMFVQPVFDGVDGAACLAWHLKAHLPAVFRLSAFRNVPFFPIVNGSFLLPAFLDYTPRFSSGFALLHRNKSVAFSILGGVF
jgi:hypothetical protein